MKGIELENTFIDSYLRLLQNQSASDKLDIIAKLSLSLKTEVADKKKSFKKYFGAFESDKSADQIIDEIRSSRIFNRQIGKF